MHYPRGRANPRLVDQSMGAWRSGEIAHPSICIALVIYSPPGLHPRGAERLSGSQVLDTMSQATNVSNAVLRWQATWTNPPGPSKDHVNTRRHQHVGGLYPMNSQSRVRAPSISRCARVAVRLLQPRSGVVDGYHGPTSPGRETVGSLEDRRCVS